MANSTYWIKGGNWLKTNKEITGGLNLRRVVKWILNSLGVTTYDNCCDSGATALPARYNTSTGSMEYYNPSTGLYEVPGTMSRSTPQTLTGAGAVSLNTYTTLLVTTGANALTLAAGTDGQFKFIRMKTDGGDGTLTVTGLQGGTTITFNDAGDFVHLFYTDSKWHILTNSGCTVA